VQNRRPIHTECLLWWFFHHSITSSRNQASISCSSHQSSIMHNVKAMPRQIIRLSIYHANEKLQAASSERWYLLFPTIISNNYFLDFLEAPLANAVIIIIHYRRELSCVDRRPLTNANNNFPILIFLSTAAYSGGFWRKYQQCWTID
jgi:hypothetical protein